MVDFADKQVTEISCHGLGARLLAPETRTVIDIGGQDSKVIQLDAQGNLSDFLMNDKCAAGTGRFLEVISRTLGASIDQLDAITEGVEPHAITSMCTVFAESEVISLRSAGLPRGDSSRGDQRYGAAQRELYWPFIGAGTAAVYRRRQPLRRLRPHAGEACWHAGRDPSRRPVCRGDRRGADRPAPAEARMSKYLFLFHSTAGVVRMRKSPAGGSDDLRGEGYSPPAAQRLRVVIYLSCMPGDEQRWVIPGETAALFASPK